MKTKNIKVCDAVHIEADCDYPHNHPKRKYIRYCIVVNPDKVEAMKEFIVKCIKKSGGKGKILWTEIKKDYPVSKLKNKADIETHICGDDE